MECLENIIERFVLISLTRFVKKGLHSGGGGGGGLAYERAGMLVGNCELNP